MNNDALPGWKAGQVYIQNNTVYIIMETLVGLRPFWICGDINGTSDFKQTSHKSEIFKGDTLIMTLDAKYMKQQILKSVGVEWEKDYVPTN